MNMPPHTKTETADGSIQTRVFGKTYMHIKSVDGGGSLDAPVYAVNWFNTRMMWLYNFYNTVATRSVTAVGGTPFLKGRITKTIHGETSDRRDALLIVNYPSPSAFKSMLESRYFMAVSVLRMLAVGNFTFGFTHRTDRAAAREDYQSGGYYAVHHYTGASDVSATAAALAADYNAEVHFSGRISSLVYTGDETEARDQVPCLMDGILVLRATAEKDLEDMLGSARYEAVVAETRSSFTGLFDRIF